MGTYTELYLSVEFKSNLPKDVEEVLRYLFGDEENAPAQLPDHEFFRCSRWSCIGRMSSYYFVPMATSQLHLDGNNYYLTTRSDLKNYDGEIGQFLDWVTPYLHALEGDHLGHFRYEESVQPTLIYFKGVK